jgi:hypothetical protein
MSAERAIGTDQQAQSAEGANGSDGAASPRSVDRRAVLLWEVGAFVVIMVGASALHFAFELSGFTEPVAIIASVNESTFEHLKLFFWPALLYALIEHAYMKDRCNNYWWGKGLAMLATPLGIIASFYFYVGIAVPLTGHGYLALDIGTGAIGVLVGNVVAYKVLTAPDKGRGRATAGAVIMAVLAFLMATSAWLTPRFFLYENFFGYEYSGDYGILEDYTPYLVFDRE